MGSDDGFGKPQKGPLAPLLGKATKFWKQRSMPERVALAVATVLMSLVLMKLLIRDHDNLFVLSEVAHFSGIGFLVYKLLRVESCEGISLKSQELTAIFLGIRLYCSFMMEYDVHTLLDLLTLSATLWVLYTMRTKLARSYNARKDSTRVELILGGCSVLALVAHPSTKHWFLNRVLWALCVYLEAISVLPQLRMLQKEPTVERWTANYVFALGIARFFSCAHWVLQLFDGNSFIFTALGSGLWPVMVLVSEIVQTGILADFCYYYIKSLASGDAVMRLPMMNMAV